MLNYNKHNKYYIIILRYTNVLINKINTNNTTVLKILLKNGCVVCTIKYWYYDLN